MAKTKTMWDIDRQVLRIKQRSGFDSRFAKAADNIRDQYTNNAYKNNEQFRKAVDYMGSMFRNNKMNSQRTINRVIDNMQSVPLSQAEYRGNAAVAAKGGIDG